MKPTYLCLFALLVPAALTGTATASRIKGGYIDILAAEAVGEFSSQQYDAYRSRDGNEVFVGTQRLANQTLLAGGLGLRLVFATANGLRFSGEGSLQGGRLLGEPQLALAESTVMRGELLMGLGYQVVLGPVVLHAAGIIGGDYATLKLVPQALGAVTSQLSSAGTVGASPLSEDITLKRWGLRLGAQAGAHLQISKLTALYGDVTFDYDGQWRTRFGIAFGESGRR